MNKVLDNVMTFINENTYLLIGICIFLILVLIGYLIDNSVKSKRIRKDIKNKDQVPENIKEEIIKDAIDNKKEEVVQKVEETKEEVKEDVQLNLNEEVKTNDSLNLEVTNGLDSELNLGETSDIGSELNLDSGFNEPLNLDNNDTLSLNLDMPSLQNAEENLNSSFTLDDLIFDTEKTEIPKVEETVTVESDPDSYLFETKEENSEYKNDKKLSDILSGINNVSKEEVNSDIFNVGNKDIVVNSDVKKDDVEIEVPNNSSDELDLIMQKLSSTNKDDEDNYTNIF